jgi:hypothetical protein
MFMLSSAPARQRLDGMLVGRCDLREARMLADAIGEAIAHASPPVQTVFIDASLATDLAPEGLTPIREICDRLGAAALIVLAD